MTLFGKHISAASAHVLNPDDSVASISVTERLQAWSTLIAERTYVMPPPGSPDVDAWLEAKNILGFLVGAHHLSNRKYYAYGYVLADTGKGAKKAFAIVTETNLWLLIGTGKKLKFFMAPHATLLSVHNQDSDTALRTKQEWTEATLLEYYRGAVPSSPITNLSLTLSPYYTKDNGHANRQSESVIAASRAPQGFHYLPAVWSGVGAHGKRGVLERGVFSISPDGEGKFISRDLTNTIGDLRLFLRNISTDMDGSVHLQVDMSSVVLFEPKYAQVIYSALEAPYQERRF